MLRLSNFKRMCGEGLQIDKNLNKFELMAFTVWVYPSSHIDKFINFSREKLKLWMILVY